MNKHRGQYKSAEVKQCQKRKRCSTVPKFILNTVFTDPKSLTTKLFQIYGSLKFKYGHFNRTRNFQISSIIGSVEHIFSFGAVVLRHCLTPPQMVSRLMTKCCWSIWFQPRQMRQNQHGREIHDGKQVEILWTSADSNFLEPQLPKLEI